MTQGLLDRQSELSKAFVRHISKFYPNRIWSHNEIDILKKKKKQLVNIQKILLNTLLWDQLLLEENFGKTYIPNMQCNRATVTLQRGTKTILLRQGWDVGVD